MPFDDTTVNGIPLIIHQTNEVPEKWKEPQESWTNQSVIYPHTGYYIQYLNLNKHHHSDTIKNICPRPSLK
jgi:mannosyltransferase OCH1-like enzyme